MQRITNYYRQLFIENRRWLKIALDWFILSALIGVVTVFIKPDLLMSIVSGFQDRFGINPSLNSNLSIQIFLQNLTASAIGLFGGILLGLGPVLVIGLNGFILGFVVTSILVLGGNIFTSLLLVAGGVLPHGIFELSAFLAAGALGLRLGMEWLKNESVGHRWQVLKKNIINAILLFPLIAVVLFIAALIEVFVSGKIVDKLQ